MQDILNACEEMYERDKARRRKLDEQLAKKAEEQVPVARKTASSALQRDMAFARLAMPNPNSKVNKAKYHVKGSAAAEEQEKRDKAKRAWFAGTSREAALKSGWRAGSTEYMGGTAVH